VVTQEHDSIVTDFITKNKEQLKKILKDIKALKPDDRKLLVGGMLSPEPVWEGMPPG
jgi:hypothetical protein